MKINDRIRMTGVYGAAIGFGTLIGTALACVMIDVSGVGLDEKSLKFISSSLHASIATLGFSTGLIGVTNLVSTVNE